MSQQAVIDRPRRISEREAGYTGSPARALAIAGVLVLALAAVWAIFALVPSVHHADASVLYKFTTHDTTRAEAPLKFLLHLLDPSLFILWGVALVAIALAGDRPRTALAVAVVLSLAPLSAELLKPLLAHSHDTVGYVTINGASWPSGHATAATALALCAVLVAPRRLRPLVAFLAGAYVLAVSIALLVLAWHEPSDVLGGILLASLWMALALAALRASERRTPAPS